MSIKLPKILIFLVHYDIGHLLETSLEYFGPNKLRKVIDNIVVMPHIYPYMYIVRTDI